MLVHVAEVDHGVGVLLAHGLHEVPEGLVVVTFY